MRKKIHLNGSVCCYPLALLLFFSKNVSGIATRDLNLCTSKYSLLMEQISQSVLVLFRSSRNTCRKLNAITGSYIIKNYLWHNYRYCRIRTKWCGKALCSSDTRDFWKHAYVKTYHHQTNAQLLSVPRMITTLYWLLHKYLDLGKENTFHHKTVVKIYSL